jgi:hypothetical protein
MSCMADETSDAITLRATKDRAQARINLQKTQALIGQLGQTFYVLAEAFSPDEESPDPPSVQWAVSKIDAELAPFFSMDRLKALVNEEESIRKKIATCTATLKRYQYE